MVRGEARRRGPRADIESHKGASLAHRGKSVPGEGTAMQVPRGRNISRALRGEKGPV